MLNGQKVASAKYIFLFLSQISFLPAFERKYLNKIRDQCISQQCARVLRAMKYSTNWRAYISWFLKWQLICALKTTEKPTIAFIRILYVSNTNKIIRIFSILMTTNTMTIEIEMQETTEEKKNRNRENHKNGLHKSHWNKLTAKEKLKRKRSMKWQNGIDAINLKQNIKHMANRLYKSLLTDLHTHTHDLCFLHKRLTHSYSVYLWNSNALILWDICGFYASQRQHNVTFDGLCCRTHLDFLSLDSYFDFYTFFCCCYWCSCYWFCLLVCGLIQFFPFFTPYEICIVWPSHHQRSSLCLCVCLCDGMRVWGAWTSVSSHKAKMWICYLMLQNL